MRDRRKLNFAIALLIVSLLVITSCNLQNSTTTGFAVKENNNTQQNETISNTADNAQIQENSSETLEENKTKNQKEEKIQQPTKRKSYPQKVAMQYDRQVPPIKHP